MWYLVKCILSQTTTCNNELISDASKPPITTLAITLQCRRLGRSRGNPI